MARRWRRRLQRDQARDQAREQVRAARAVPEPREPPPRGSIPVDHGALAPLCTHVPPAFVERGYYVDAPFTCVDCGAAQVFTAAQQQWWYEVAKGNVLSVAKRCAACRRARRPPRRQSARSISSIEPGDA